MPKDHYMLEDYDMLIQELENIRKVFTHVHEGALNGNFDHLNQQRSQFERSIQIIMALNARKMQRDTFEKQNKALYTRKGWTNA